MPRFPAPSPHVRSIRGSVYSALAHRLATYPGEVYPFHVGDTWLDPAPGCQMADLDPTDHPGLHRYAPVQGRPTLLDAVVDKERQLDVPTERGNVLITAGATGGLAAVIGAVVAPGDEVLILAPFWPLVAGMVHATGGVPVPVHFYGAVDGPEAAIEAVTDKLTERTVALYLNTPNNPTGHTIDGRWLEALADWARAHDLWIFSDEVYEQYAYDGPHTHTRPLAPERTFAVYSMSKAYGMAGYRTGYVIGPADTMAAIQKISVHAFYSTPTAGQVAAERILDGRGEAWVEAARTVYQRAGNAAAARLGVARPQGSTFLFLDVSDHLDDRGLGGFLEDCVDRGLFLAPGPSFGPYPTHVRLCFTAAPPDITGRGIEVLAGLMGR